MPFIAKNADGRVPIAATTGTLVIGVVLERSLPQNGGGAVRVRPTNTTATINVVAGTGTVDQTEREAAKAILLHNGNNGGFTQEVDLVAGTYLVSDNVAGIFTRTV